MTDHKIRSGSLQFWPRKRARKLLSSVNWKPINREGLQGFIGYKAGMVSVYAKDNTDDSMTKNKRIVIPATILECPPMRIFSVRLYKENKVLRDIIVDFDDKLKKKIKKPKEIKKIGEIKEDYDDLRVIVYSNIKKTSIKKKPDMIELALGGGKNDKLNFIKEMIGKDISVADIFSKGLVDVRGVTKGYGTHGPVKRFGITLKVSKAEKGQRRPGALAPWHPSRVTFRAPQAGQTGYHSRITYNNLILQVGKITETNINKKGGFKKFGKIKTEYIILRGSIPGPRKRVLLITPALRPTKYQTKKNFEIISLK